ncbi:hypothetical protein Cri9333_2117 [Crinalium epipsammum PCC 9333]|uniref:Uncharacterized protein n=1 Tax=Crinalium epipsammum PCC 9333 TaxID=1173022 RepID=K9VZM4_9CYAN|nr:hypothetical protein [Crinalium epipsammum]AFZ12994.1 hypothetical protein Cri9333_2117 [Crinalium epipsammum PCC 9333]
MKLIAGRLDYLISQLSDLIDQIPDENLEDAWKVMQGVYYDLYILQAIQQSRQNVQPGDTLSREEALQFLHF